MAGSSQSTAVRLHAGVPALASSAIVTDEPGVNGITFDDAPRATVWLALPVTVKSNVVAEPAPFLVMTMPDVELVDRARRGRERAVVERRRGDEELGAAT